MHHLLKKEGFKIKPCNIIVSLLMIAALVAAASGEDNKNISISALLDMTGDDSSQGINDKAVLQIASSDVNSYLDSIGSKERVVLDVRDAQSDPAAAQRELQNLSRSGIKLVLATTTSAEIEAMKDYADKNGIMIIGAASTAPTLAIPGDNLIRPVPDDSNQGFAIAQIFRLENISAVVPITRGDVWGDGLLNEAAKSFEADGGKMLKGIRFSPGTDFSSEAEDLSTLVKEAKRSYGADRIGVYLISLDEGTSLLSLAAGDPELSSVRWFGSDGTAGLKSISENRSLAQFAARTGFVCPIAGVPPGFSDSDGYKRLISSVLQRTGTEPNFYSIASYDAFWAAWQSIILSEYLNSTDLKDILADTIDRYSGISGPLKLNPAGDREYAFYDFMAIAEENGNYSWRSSGNLDRWGTNLSTIVWKGQIIPI